MMTAVGQFGASLFFWGTAHDVAAIKIIVEEAGGKVTDIDGNDQRYDQECNGLIASNGLIHDELVEIVKEFRKN
jgi:fructose-1,6-bisphosphatase/inositol monophosphatase family enzyme